MPNSVLLAFDDPPPPLLRLGVELPPPPTSDVVATAAVFAGAVVGVAPSIPNSSTTGLFLWTTGLALRVAFAFGLGVDVGVGVGVAFAAYTRGGGSGVLLAVGCAVLTIRTFFFALCFAATGFASWWAISGAAGSAPVITHAAPAPAPVRHSPTSPAAGPKRPPPLDVS